MQQDILQQLVRLLGRRPQQEYLDTLLDYPEPLRAARRAVDETDSEGVVSEVEFVLNPACVLDLNLEARRGSLVDPEGVEYAWPDSLLIIGETGSGDYYCIDVEAATTEVIQYNHQAVEWDVIADSLDEFVEILVDTFCAEASPGANSD